MRLSEAELSSNLDEAAPTADDSGKTMPLSGLARSASVLDAGEAEMDSTRPTSKIFNQGTLLILVVFLLAAGTLYVMRISQGDLMSNMVSTKFEAVVDTALANLRKREDMEENHPLHRENLRELLQDADEIVAVFSLDPTQRQVPIEYVQKNPFVLPATRVVVTDVDPISEPRPKNTMAQLRKLESELKTLELQSLIDKGRVPVAIINGDIVLINHVIGSFTVTAIRNLGVELSAVGHTFTLRMDKRES